MANTILGQILENATSYGANTTAGTAATLHKKFNNGVADYLEQYVTISGTFSGVSGDSSLTTGLTCKINASMVRAQTLSGAAGFGAWQQQIYNILRTFPVIMPGTFTPMGMIPAFSLIQVSWTQNDLKNVAADHGKDGHSNCMDMIGTDIRKDLRKGFTPSIPGTVGSYVGALSISSVTTP